MKRYAMWVGCAWLAASVVACAGADRQVRQLDPHPVGASSGQGGGAEIDTGEWAWLNETYQSEQARRELYGRVTRELGLEQPSVSVRGAPAGMGGAAGGGGRAGGERRGCAEVLAANEPAVVLSGTLDFAQDGLLTVNVPGMGPMKLRTGEGTCAVQARRVLSPESLLEGVEVRVSYVMEQGLPTARVVRAEPLRFLR
jgi:hypothetical protein